MKLRNPSTPAFTLLELVVVLAILSVVTALAVRALDRVEDQRRYEAAQRSFEELEAAIVGSPDDRAADGTRTLGGFVADMGRLPRAVGSTNLSLAELLESPGVTYDIRPAIQLHGVPLASEDPQVLVPGGWRGPYLRLPTGTTTLLDAWGNPMTSPAMVNPPAPETTGYARLRDAGDNPITTAGQEVRIIRHLGANGKADALDTGYDRDQALVLGDDQFKAAISGHVEVLDGDSPATPDLGDSVTIRVFGPDSANPAQISVINLTVPFTTNPVTWSIPVASGATIGPRVIRAYFDDANSSGTTNFRKSAVKPVTLRPGANRVDLVIDR